MPKDEDQVATNMLGIDAEYYINRNPFGLYSHESARFYSYLFMRLMDRPLKIVDTIRLLYCWEGYGDSYVSPDYLKKRGTNLG